MASQLRLWIVAVVAAAVAGSSVTRTHFLLPLSFDRTAVVRTRPLVSPIFIPTGDDQIPAYSNTAIPQRTTTNNDGGIGG